MRFDRDTRIAINAHFTIFNGIFEPHLIQIIINPK